MDGAENMTPASLRRTALVWTTLLLTLVGIIAILIAYALARAEAADFLDGQLRQIALNAGRGLPDADAPPAPDQDPEDQIAITIWKKDQIVHTTLNQVSIARPTRPGYDDVTIAGHAWRAYTANNDTWTIQVAQRETVRQEFASSAAIGVAAPILIIIPLSWLVVGWALNRTLARLDLVAQDLASKSALAAGPISLAGIPTELHPLVLGMNSLIGRLRAAVASQKQFLSDAAHELRTPLAAMQIQVDRLEHGAGAADEEIFEEKRVGLDRGVKRANALVTQLLRMARLDEPNAPVADALDVGQLLLDCVGDFAVLAERRGIDLGLHVERAAMVRGSSEELRVLLANLIENAVRYTPSGGKVDVFVQHRGGCCEVEVLDTGPGLPEGSELRIFERFFRAAPAGIEGTGLGLAIAKRIAERHSATITVENRTDGSTGVRARVVFPA